MQTSSSVSWKKPLALAITLTLLGGGAYWLEYSHRPKTEENEKLSKKLINLKDTPVASIELVSGESHYKFKCLDLEVKLCKPGDQSKWEMEIPGRMRADDSNINSILSAVNNLTPSTTIDLAEESPEKRSALLQEYGLSQEARDQSVAKRIEITLASGEKRTLFFGETHPMGGALLTYSSEVGDQKVFLSPGYFKSNFEKDLTYWRNKKLFSLSTSQVKAIHLENGQGIIDAERSEAAWTLKASGKKSMTFPGDAENIDSLISSTAFLTAKRFPAENKDSPEGKSALKGLRSVLTLTLQTEQGPSTLTLFEKTRVENGKNITDSLMATVSNLDPVFELDKTAKDRLNKGLRDLRLTKLLSTTERFETRKIEFSGRPIGDKALVLESKEGKWSYTQPNDPVSGPKDVPADRIQNTLDRLTGNRIKDFLAGASIPKGESEGIRVKVSNEKGDPMKELLFWKKDNRLFARDLTTATQEAFLVDPSIQEALPWTSDYFNTPAAADNSHPGAEAAHDHAH